MRDGDGLFVVFEGIDGAGTTTQIERYAARLRAKKRAVHVTREPSTGPIGSLIRLVLTHRLSFASTHHAEMMALLFAADRLDHVEAEIAPMLRDGWVVLSDRYDLSSLVYQSVTSEIAAEEAPNSVRGPESKRARATPGWIQQLNCYARRPHVTVVVDVNADIAATRRSSRGGPRELFDDHEIQTRLARAYLDAERFVPGDSVVHVDGSADLETVEQAIADALAPFVEK